MPCGIYKIINKVNGKFYLGSSKDIAKRWKRHQYNLNHNKHHSIQLQRAWKKHGEENFYLDIICELNENELKEQEQKMLNELQPWINGYNISKQSDGGDLVSYHPKLDEIKEKHRINGLKMWRNKTPEERKIFSEKRNGEDNPNWKGGSCKTKCPLCDKQIDKNNTTPNKTCSKCRKRTGKNNPFYGKHHTNETKIILRQKQLNKTHNEDTKKLCRDKMNNYFLTEAGEAHRQKIKTRMAGKNHPLHNVGHSEESKLKISINKRKANSERTVEEKITMFLNHNSIQYMVLANNLYFLSLKDASNYFKLSDTTIKFRCKSNSPKWSDFYLIDKNYVKLNYIGIVSNIKQRLENSF